MGKCKKCCTCCIKPENDEKEKKDLEAAVEGKEAKKGFMSKLNWCKKEEKEETDIEAAAGKVSLTLYISMRVIHMLDTIAVDRIALDTPAKTRDLNVNL